MRDRSALERRLGELREELGRVEGGPTEVYSRIVGYYRSVRNWNAGKREEYDARRVFVLPQAAPPGKSPSPSRVGLQLQAPGTGGEDPDAPPTGFLVFTRAACPKCPPVANFVRSSGMAAVFVDVDREDGLKLARRHGVMATPTVLELDAKGGELFRACDVTSLKTELEARAAFC